MYDLILFTRKAVEIFRFGAIIGLIVATTLFVNINNKAFNTVFRERAKSYFWFFLMLSVIPLLVFIYIFSFLFGKLTYAMGPVLK